jgi:hypothetical protein
MFTLQDIIGVVLILFIVGVSAEHIVGEIMETPAERNLNACTHACGSAGVREFSSPPDGSTVCICGN